MLSVVTSKFSNAKKKKPFSLGLMASGHLPLAFMHNCEIMIGDGDSLAPALHPLPSSGKVMEHTTIKVDLLRDSE